MDTNSLTTAGCVLAFSVLVIGVLVLRALYRIADLDTDRKHLYRSLSLANDRITAVQDNAHRELGSYKTTLTDLHHSAEKAASYIKKIQELASKIDKVDMDLTNRIDAACRLSDAIDGRVNATNERINSELSVYADVESRIAAILKKIDTLHATSEKAAGRMRSLSSTDHEIMYKIEAVTKRLDAVMEEWSTLRADVETVMTRTTALGQNFDQWMSGHRSTLARMDVIEKSILSLEKKNDGRIIPVPPTKEYQIDPEHVKGEDGVSLAEIVRRNRRRAMEALRTQQRIDLERCYMDAVKAQVEQMSRDILKSKPPIDQVPNPGE